MTKDEIKMLINQGEGEKVEFKESLSLWKEIIETISAFSNTKGGTILVGVSNKNEPLGIDIGKRTFEDIINKIRQNTDPIVFPSVSVESIQDKKILIIEVNEAMTRPVLAFGRAFKRISKINHRLSAEEIRKITIQTGKVYWDEELSLI